MSRLTQWKRENGGDYVWVILRAERYTRTLRAIKWEWNVLQYIQKDDYGPSWKICLSCTRDERSSWFVTIIDENENPWEWLRIHKKWKKKNGDLYCVLKARLEDCRC